MNIFGHLAFRKCIFCIFQIVILWGGQNFILDFFLRGLSILEIWGSYGCLRRYSCLPGVGLHWADFWVVFGLPPIFYNQASVFVRILKINTCVIRAYFSF